MARDWLTTLRRASFRGVSFHVEAEDNVVGRRVAVHDISGGEAPVTEDMGALAREFSVAAYVAGDAADRVGLTLEAACGAPGPSLLMLPMDAARLMHCVGCRRHREKDRAGYVAYDLAFVEAGAAGVASGGFLATLRTIFAAGAATAAAALSSL
jgi:prophage DNA circulation protein